MKPNTLIELGSITDTTGNCWDVYASDLTFTGRGEDLDVIAEGIVLELAADDETAEKARIIESNELSQSGVLIRTLNVESLAEMPDRFSQRQVNALEAVIIEKERISHQAYLQDLYWDSKREEV